MAGAKATAHFQTLDALRGVVAVNVMFCHAVTIFIGSDSNVLGAGLSVDFFFMLSGFVVTHAYEGKLKSSMSKTEYLLRRAIRLYPLAIVGTSLGLIAELFEPRPNVFLNYLFNVVALPSPVSHVGAFPINIPSWSLFVEIILSILFIPMIRAGSHSLIAVAAVSALVYAMCIISIGTFPMLARSLPAVAGVFARGVGPFVIGIVLRRLLVKTPPWLFPIAAFLSLAVLLVPLPVTAIAVVTCVVLLFPITVSSAAIHQDLPGAAFLGMISYPIYIVHYPIILIARQFLGLGWGPLLVSVMVCLLAAYAAARYYDAPIRALLSHHLLRSPLKVR